MKKIVLLVTLILSTVAFSQNQKCIIHFKDGKTLEGLGRLKFDGRVKFRLNEDADSEFINSEQISTVEVENDENLQTFVYKKVKDDYPIWMKIIITGKVNLYTNDVSGFNFSTINAQPGFGGGIAMGGGGAITYFYVDHEGESEVFKIASTGTIGGNFRNSASYFFKDCPVLIEKIQNKTYKKSNLEEIVAFYNSNCTTPAENPSTTTEKQD